MTESERPPVSLRAFTAADAESIHRWFNNQRATSSLMEVRDRFTIDDARGWADRAGAGDGEDRKYAIVIEGFEGAVGFTALYGLFRQTPPELGALIGEDTGVRGVGREAERLTVAKAFEEFGAHRVYGRIPAFNESAKRAVSWQGWTHEGTMREHLRRPDGTLIDCEIWGITEPEWRERWQSESS